GRLHDLLLAHVVREALVVAGLGLLGLLRTLEDARRGAAGSTGIRGIVRVGREHRLAHGPESTTPHRHSRAPVREPGVGARDNPDLGQIPLSHGPAGLCRVGRVNDGAKVRVDVWTWSARLYKTRSAAASACRAGHVRVAGERAKPSTPVRIGDEIRART